MARVKVPRLQPEVRLRNWPAGRVSQLKLFLGHLEQAIGISLAAQVEQSPKRKFSEFVPKIVSQSITLDVEFREIRFFFDVPRGQKNLLFYEFDISLTEGFFNLDRFASPDPSYVFAGLEDGQKYFIRARVVTKNGEVGPFSDAQNGTTPAAQAFGIYDGTEFEVRVIDSVFYPWQVVWERTYTAIGGKSYYSLDYDVSVFQKYTADGNVEWADLEFKWMDKSPSSDPIFEQVGQTFNVTTYSTNGVYSQAPFYEFAVTTNNFYTPLVMPGQWDNAKRGTFVQKFQTLEAGAHTLRLEANMITNHNSPEFKNDFVFSSGGQVLYAADVGVFVKNFSIFEALVE
ncbi:hypothetical protein LCGC14_1847720 [marine sediment metagenome]|uniref:Fibronectin type-III domain-containing protein n=1 Tax=marine sediment metagenome TaxID=412755 RepID=A0A0F9IQW0_9ZZZZ